MQTDDIAIEKQIFELEKLRSMIRGYLGKLCHDAEVAESLTQMTLYQARLSLPDFRGECPLSAWVLEIANKFLKKHFEGEIEKLRSMIRGYFGKRCQEAEVAENLTQETLYQACRSLAQFRGDCPLSAWVQQIAENLWKKHIKRDPYQTGKVISRDFTQSQEDSSAQGQQKPLAQGPESEVLSALFVQQFLQKMSHCCSPEEAYVIRMHIQGVPLVEIAEDLEEKPATIRSQLLRGRGKLFAHLVLNAPDLLGGKACIEEAYQAALRAKEITAREAAAWKSPQGKADDFRSACLKMAEYLRIVVLLWPLWAVLFRRF